jgi:hypothetical protein
MTLTLEGQYIVKNMILASAALVIAAHYTHPAPKQRQSGARRLASGSRKRRSVPKSTPRLHVALAQRPLLRPARPVQKCCLGPAQRLAENDAPPNPPRIAQQ